VLLAATVTPAWSVPPPTAERTYLILPFENTGEDPTLAWMQTGLARALGEELLGRGAAVVDDEERAVFLEGSGLPADASPALASALEVGRRMRARAGGIRPDRLLLGRFNLTDGSIFLTARAIDLEAEKARPWVSRQGRVASLLAVEQELARALAQDEALPEPRGRSADVPLLAFETYCRAMAESDLKRRLQLLQRAVHEYPAYARAAYQAAALLVPEERWDDAAAMLKKAAPEPYPYEADFHLMSATVALSRNDPQTAAAQARRALQFNDTPRAHLLLGRALLASGDRAQALAELEKAQSVDPTDPDVEELRRALGEEATSTTRRSP
jgi:hypothetical protein